MRATQAFNGLNESFPNTLTFLITRNSKTFFEIPKHSVNHHLYLYYDDFSILRQLSTKKSSEAAMDDPCFPSIKRFQKPCRIKKSCSKNKPLLKYVWFHI